MPRLLHHNNLGYVAHCPCTGYLQVCFGTMALGATRAEFSGLRECVTQMALLVRRRAEAAACACPECRAATADPDARRITLRTPLPTLALVLTQAELFAFEHLLDTAALLLEAEVILGLAPPHEAVRRTHGPAAADDAAGRVCY